MKHIGIVPVIGKQTEGYGYMKAGWKSDIPMNMFNRLRMYYDCNVEDKSHFFMSKIAIKALVIINDVKYYTNLQQKDVIIESIASFSDLSHRRAGVNEPLVAEPFLDRDVPIFPSVTNVEIHIIFDDVIDISTNVVFTNFRFILEFQERTVPTKSKYYLYKSLDGIFDIDIDENTTGIISCKDAYLESISGNCEFQYRKVENRIIIALTPNLKNIKVSYNTILPDLPVEIFLVYRANENRIEQGE